MGIFASLLRYVYCRVTSLQDGGRRYLGGAGISQLVGCKAPDSHGEGRVFNWAKDYKYVGNAQQKNVSLLKILCLLENWEMSKTL